MRSSYTCIYTNHHHTCPSSFSVYRFSPADTGLGSSHTGLHQMCSTRQRNGRSLGEHWGGAHEEGELRPRPPCSTGSPQTSERGLANHRKSCHGVSAVGKVRECAYCRWCVAKVPAYSPLMYEFNAVSNLARHE